MLAIFQTPTKLDLKQGMYLPMVVRQYLSQANTENVWITLHQK